MIDGMPAADARNEITITISGREAEAYILVTQRLHGIAVETRKNAARIKQLRKAIHLLTKLTEKGN